MSTDTPEFPEWAEAFFERVAAMHQDAHERMVKHVNRRFDELRDEMVKHFADDSESIKENSKRLANAIMDRAAQATVVFQSIADSHKALGAAHAKAGSSHRDIAAAHTIAGAEIEKSLNGSGERLRYLRDTDRAPHKIDPDAETNPEGHAVPERD